MKSVAARIIEGASKSKVKNVNEGYEEIIISRIQSIEYRLDKFKDLVNSPDSDVSKLLKMVSLLKEDVDNLESMIKESADKL